MTSATARFHGSGRKSRSSTFGVFELCGVFRFCFRFCLAAAPPDLDHVGSVSADDEAALASSFTGFFFVELMGCPVGVSCFAAASCRLAPLVGVDRGEPSFGHHQTAEGASGGLVGGFFL